MRSHMLVPLTRITSDKINFNWTKTEQDAFYEIKWIMARDTLLTYLYFIETFKIHTDASNFQLGEVIRQKDKLIDFCSRKRTGTHKGL